jgi:hypothetical protein
MNTEKEKGSKSCILTKNSNIKLKILKREVKNCCKGAKKQKKVEGNRRLMLLKVISSLLMQVMELDQCMMNQLDVSLEY